MRPAPSGHQEKVKQTARDGTYTRKARKARKAQFFKVRKKRGRVAPARRTDADCSLPPLQSWTNPGLSRCHPTSGSWIATSAATTSSKYGWVLLTPLFSSTLNCAMRPQSGAELPRTVRFLALAVAVSTEPSVSNEGDR